MEIKRLFGSVPAFQLGDHVYWEFSYEDAGDEVVRCKSYGLITGFMFCSEYSKQIGWEYQVQNYKDIIEYEFRREIDLYPNLNWCVVIERDLRLCEEKVNSLKYLHSLKSKICSNIEKNFECKW